MKTVIASLVIVFSCFAQAKHLKAWVSCNCTQWVRGTNGGMSLVTAPIGVAQMPELSEAFSTQLVTYGYEQSETTKAGYASVTPAFAKLLGNGTSIFERGDSAIDYVNQECKKIAASDDGYTNCALSITFPINEQAKELVK